MIKFDPALAKQNINYEQQLEIANKIANTLKKVVVKDEETLNIARKTLGNASTLIDSIETQRKDLIKPYQEIIDGINEIAKSITSEMQQAYEDTKRNAVLWQTTSIDKALIDYNKKMEENEKVVEEATEKYHFIIRIKNQIMAKVFGGSYTTKTGEVKTIACPVKLSELVSQLAYIKDTTPTGEKVAPFESIVDSIKKLVLTAGSQLMQLMTEKVECENAVDMASIDKRISLLRVNTETEIDKLIDSATLFLKKFVKDLNKSCENELKAVAKGTRKNVKYSVEDISLVPVDYLEVNDKKVKEFIKNNKEKIEDNEQLLRGIHFFITRSAVIEKL